MPAEPSLTRTTGICQLSSVSWFSGRSRPAQPLEETIISANPISADDKKFSQMNGGEKLVFMVKLVVFLGTFGFAFGTLLD